MRDPVTLTKKAYRQYRWRVIYPKEGKRTSKWFARKSDAEEFARKTREDLKQHGELRAVISDEERNAVISFRNGLRNVQGGKIQATLQDAVDFYLDHLGRSHRSISCESVSTSLLKRIRDENRSDDHYRNVSYKLDRFIHDYGEWLACDVSTGIIDEFLNDLALKPQSVVNYRSVLYQLFNHAVRIGAADVNPVENAIRPKIVESETKILTPAQVRKVLSVASARVRPAVAISYFAGVRRAEIERLEWSEVDIDKGVIEIKARKAKSARRRTIRIHDNLQKWLITHPNRTGKIISSPAIHRQELEAIAEAVKFKIPRNAGRHSFASYHLAHFENQNQLAQLLGHPDTALIYNRYRELVTGDAASSYWSIAPADRTGKTKTTAKKNG